MKIYITGIAGLLGYSIYHCLKDKEEVDGFDIVETEDRGMSYHHISLFDTEAVEQELKAIMPSDRPGEREGRCTDSHSSPCQCG